MKALGVFLNTTKCLLVVPPLPYENLTLLNLLELEGQNEELS